MSLDPYIGQIMPTGFNFAPVGWALCDGSMLSISSNQPLYALIGTTYGGNLTKGLFALPDLRGLVIIGTMPGLAMGSQGGASEILLSEAEMPNHNHTISVSSKTNANRTVDPSKKYFAPITQPPNEKLYDLAGSGGVPLAKGTNVQLTGNGAPHTNMQPYLTINYVIALEGMFPPHS